MTAGAKTPRHYRHIRSSYHLAQMRIGKMKSVNHSNRQSGFFDLGMSLLVLAIAGGVVYGVENSHAEKTAANQQELASQQVVHPAMADASGINESAAGTASQ
jgi:hypothetical protein